MAQQSPVTFGRCSKTEDFQSNRTSSFHSRNIRHRYLRKVFQSLLVFIDLDLDLMENVQFNVFKRFDFQKVPRALVDSIAGNIFAEVMRDMSFHSIRPLHSMQSLFENK